jgi:uncharacterized membrane protein
MGIWSDSLLFDLVIASVFPSTATAVTFALIFALGVTSVMAMRLLPRHDTMAA